MISKEKFTEEAKKFVSMEEKYKFERVKKQMRILMLLAVLLFALCFIIPVVISVVLMFDFVDLQIVLAAYVSPLACFTIAICLLNKRKNVYVEWKSGYLNEIFKILLGDYRYNYSAKQKLKKHYLYESGFMNVKSLGTYDIDDLLEISFTANNSKETELKFSLCDVIASVRENDGRAKKVFDGVFGFVEFPEKFNFKVSINSHITGVEKLKLEDVNFNKEFDIRTDNPVETFYIITPKIMQDLQKFQEKTAKKLKFSIVDKYLYIGLEKANFFEFDMNTLTIEQFERIYDEINLIITLVNEIRNNRTLTVKK